MWKDVSNLHMLATFLGALLVIGAMGWFITDSWDRFLGWQLTAIALIYAGLFVLAGSRVWRKSMYRVPDGLLITIALCMTPLPVYGIERQLHLWPQLDPGRIRTFIRSSMRVGSEWRSGRFSLRSWHCAISSYVSYSAGALRIVVHVYGPHRPCIRKSLVDFSPIVHRVRDLWSRNVADLL